MDRRIIGAIVRKDLTVVFRSRGVRLPLLIAPAIILIVLPLLLVGGSYFLVEQAVDVVPQETGLPVEQVADEQVEATGLAPEQAWAVFILEYFLAPLYLLIPLIAATVIAADSFAGERERGTLEALLHTPASDEELLVAKMLSSWLPATTIAIVGFVVYSIVANVVAWPMMGRVFFPSAAWIALAFWVAPAVAGLGLGMMVLVSSRVESLQAAHQIGSLVVLPIVLLVIAQVTGALLFSLETVLLAGVVLWLLVALLLLRGQGRFTRDGLAARM